MNNNLNLIGHVGNAPEFKTFDSGHKLAKFSLSVKEFGTKGNNATMWVTVEAWNAVADRVMENITQGREIAATGRLGINLYPKVFGTETVDMAVPVLKLSGFHLCGAKPKTTKAKS